MQALDLGEYLGIRAWVPLDVIKHVHQTAHTPQHPPSITTTLTVNHYVDLYIGSIRAPSRRGCPACGRHRPTLRNQDRTERHES